MKASRSGFTIVELLIVIVVIGILAAITIVAYNGVQARARDSTRMSDIRAIAKAVEEYRAINGTLPESNGWCTQISNPNNGWGASFQSQIAPYLAHVPLDPLYAGTGQDYFYHNVDGQTFYLYAELEGSDRADDGISGCSRINNTANEYDLRYPSF